MLRLNRKKGESIVVETSEGLAEIVVMGFTPSQVQLGIQAPRGIGVWREEIYESVRENREAAQTGVSPSGLASQLAESQVKAADGEEGLTEEGEQAVTDEL